jgi:UDP-N-acetylglucosamine acyltransferase
MARIHPTAIVDAKAELHDTVEVGPYSCIGPGVQIGEGTVVGPHVMLSGPLRMGRRNRIYPFASVGALSQDKTAQDSDDTATVIGDDNQIREYVSIQRGTLKEWETKRGETRIGSRNLIMNYCHVAHDCVIGNDVIMANNASLAGHVEIGDFAGLGGYTLVYQFCRIGAHAFTAFSSGISGDVPPFVLVQGNPAQARSINKTGLQRRGFAAEEIEAIEDAYKLIYRSGKLMADIKAGLAERAPASAAVRQMYEFITSGKRPLQR